MTNIQIDPASMDTVLTKQAISVRLEIPASCFTEGWAVLPPIFEGCPDHEMMKLDGLVSDEQLRLRVALFHYAASLLPMGTLEFHTWARKTDPADYTSWFVGGYLAGEDGDFALCELSTEQLIELRQSISERIQVLQKAA